MNGVSNASNTTRTTICSTVGEMALAPFKKLHALFFQHIPPAPPQTAPSRLAQLDGALLRTIANFAGQPLQSLSKAGNQTSLAFRCTSLDELSAPGRQHSTATMLDVRFGDQAPDALPTTAAIENAAKRMPHITDIRVSGKNVNNRMIRDIAQSFTKLQRLSIQDSDQVTDVIARRVTRLSALRIHSCKQISNAALHMLRDRKAALKSLEITNYPKIDAAGFDRLSGMLVRERVKGRPRNLGHRYRNRIAPSGLKNLTFLKTSHFHEIDAIFATLRHINPKLRLEDTTPMPQKVYYCLKEFPQVSIVIGGALVIAAIAAIDIFQQNRMLSQCIANMGLSDMKSELCQRVEGVIHTISALALEKCHSMFSGRGFSIYAAEGRLFPRVLDGLCETYAKG